MGDYSNLIVIVLIVALRFLMDRLIVRGEDRRRLTDLDKPRIYSLIINAVTIASIIALIIFVGDTPLFVGLALGLFALFGLSQSWLEKKYLPNTKRHIATLLSIGCAIIVLGSYMLFYPMT